MNGKEFKAWRETGRLSLQDVADMTGVTKSVVWRFEKDKAITSKNYQKLVDVASGKEIETQDRKTKIRWHIKQLEILIESED